MPVGSTSERLMAPDPALLSTLRDQALAYISLVQDTVSPEIYNDFLDVFKGMQAGVYTEKDVYHEVNELFIDLDDPHFYDLMEGLIYFMPEVVMEEIRFEIEQQANQWLVPQPDCSDLQELVTYAWFVQARVSPGVYQRFIDIFIVYTADWPRLMLPREAYEAIKLLFVDTPDLMEGLMKFMTDQDQQEIQATGEWHAN